MRRTDRHRRPIYFGNTEWFDIVNTLKYQTVIIMRHIWIGLLLGLLITTSTLTAAPPKIILSKVYQQGIDLGNYWVSEKLDGVRAYWDGQQFKSRQDNIYHAPHWFTANLPKQPLDGELWIGRNTFQQLISTVRKKRPNHDAWREVKYMVFDLPGSKMPFTTRLAKLKELIPQTDQNMRLVEQFRVSDHTQLMARLDEVIAAGGEGLMLHHNDSLYLAGRSSNLLKVKRSQDAEAVVTRHLAGKGKFKGMLGSIEVALPDGQHFRIGSGFSHQERRKPPPIGSTITYRYFGLSKKGIPRFASFLRVREHY